MEEGFAYKSWEPLSLASNLIVLKNLGWSLLNPLKNPSISFLTYLVHHGCPSNLSKNVVEGLATEFPYKPVNLVFPRLESYSLVLRLFLYPSKEHNNVLEWTWDTPMRLCQWATGWWFLIAFQVAATFKVRGGEISHCTWSDLAQCGWKFGRRKDGNGHTHWSL